MTHRDPDPAHRDVEAWLPELRDSEDPTLPHGPGRRRSGLHWTTLVAAVALWAAIGLLIWWGLS